MDWSKVKGSDSIQEILRKVVTPEEWELIRQNYLKGKKLQEEKRAKANARNRAWREKKKAEREAMLNGKDSAKTE